MSLYAQYGDLSAVMKSVISLLLLVSLYSVQSVDRSKFKSCDQSGFCKRCRAVQPGASLYEVEPNTLHVSPTSLDTLVVNNKNGVKFKLSIIGLVDNTFRLKINEAYPLKQRFEVPLVLVSEPEPAAISVVSRDDKKIVLSLGSSSAVLHFNPLRVDFYSGDNLVLSTNARGMMKFEHLRHRKGSVEPVEGAGEVLEEEETEPDMWEESYGGHTDSKPNGPSAIGTGLNIGGRFFRFLCGGQSVGLL